MTEPTVCPAPPHRCILWAIATLRSRSARGDYPPDGYLETLEAIEQAQTTGQTVQLQILGETNITDFIAKEI